MAKVKTSFFCQNCGAQSAKWIGHCPSCKEWNTYVEEVIQKKEDNKSGVPIEKRNARIKNLTEVDANSTPRITLPDEELNRVLGGGVVPGSLILIGGEPGIGKSTLMLQIAIKIPDKKVAYISGEESEQQIKMRADRLGIENENCHILTETSTQTIYHQLNDSKPDLVIIDSIQTLHTSVLDASPGSISQIRETTAELIRYAKESRIPIFLIGHITKDGQIAGPKILEHMVDVVLQFEGDRNHLYRLLRTIKNRFGSTNELGIYEMSSMGLSAVINPSQVLISTREENLSGTAIGATVEGIRPFLVEVQALVSSAAYGTPQRTSTGFDTRRLNMLLAVLEKRCGFKLGSRDVFINIAGGIRINDPALDLAVIAAVMSSSADIPVMANACFSAEIGLSGEVRPVNRIEQRVMEAQKLGFNTIFISKYNKKGISQADFDIEILFMDKVESLVKRLFG